MATGLDAYGGTPLEISSAVVKKAGGCVICGLPNNHPAAPPAGGGTEDTYAFTRLAEGVGTVFVAHPTCWRLFHAAQPFAVYRP